MKRILLSILICCIALPVFAQKTAPKWMDRARKAVVTITIYDKDNKQTGVGYGVLVSEAGEGLSGYTLFKNADRAVITDVEGKQYPVTHIIGLDEMYDVIRFKVALPKKPGVTFLPIAADPQPQASAAYLISYTTDKNPVYKTGEITEVSPLKESFSYYQLNTPLEPTQLNLPWVNANGEVTGLAQEDATGKNETSYAVSAAYAGQLTQSSVDVFNSSYRNIGIRKGWASNPEDAAVSLFLLSSQQSATEYLGTVNDFITTFPNFADGYQNRASLYALRRAELSNDPDQQKKYLEMAEADMKTALSLSTDKSESYYTQAKLIYGLAAADETIDSPNWSLDAALASAERAIREKDEPVYHQLKGDIYFMKEDYVSAFEEYSIFNNSGVATPVSYYWAAKALENIPGANISDMIAQLNKAIELYGTPLSTEAAPYLLERIDKYLLLGLYEEAVKDYDDYYYLVNGQVNDSFYYLREQARFRQGDLEGALEDIQMAIGMNGENPDYYAEEASVYIRLQDYSKGLESVEKALALADDFSSCYRLKGICLQRMERKNEACEAFQKAKELGDPLADKLIRDNCNE